MQRIIEVKPAPGYVLELRFNDGACGSVDLSSRLFGPMFEPLQDVKLFNQVRVDEFGAISWPNGADLAPDALYDYPRKETECGIAGGRAGTRTPDLLRVKQAL